MAKDKENTERQSIEPVANCDQLSMAVEQQLSNQDDIARLIMNIRGKQVMVDRDLAIPSMALKPNALMSRYAATLSDSLNAFASN